MRSRQKTGTALESLHVPVSAAAATMGPTPTRALGERVIGVTAMALAASVAIQNAVVVWAGAPAFGASTERFEGKVSRPDATSMKTVAGSSCWARASMPARVVSDIELYRLAMEVPPTCKAKGDEWVLATLAMPLAMAALDPSSPPAM